MPKKIETFNLKMSHLITFYLKKSKIYKIRININYKSAKKNLTNDIFQIY